MIFILLSIFLVLLGVHWLRLINESKRLNVPGPMPLPILGNTHQLLVTSTEFLNLVIKMWMKYGDAFRFHIFSTPFVILTHPKYIEPFMTRMDLITKGLSYKFLFCWLGQGLLTSTGQRWKTHRKFLTPAFHFNILQDFLPIFCKNQKILTNKLQQIADTRDINIFPIVALAALDNVTESVMGVGVEAQKYSESPYVKAIDELASIISMRMQIPIIGEDFIFNKLSYKGRQDKALQIIHNESRKVIKARREKLKRNNITVLEGTNEFGVKNKHAFLDLLLLSEIDGKGIDEESIREEVDTFMFEGHDTTTAGIVYTLYCLSKHRDIQERIYEELKTIFRDDMARDPTYNELHQMKYLELVIKESMRLYPPVPIIQRLIEKDIDVGDFKFTQGTTVVINIFQMQRHPDLYDDPLEFKPERFEVPLKNPFNWLAFSAGPRNCIGQKFAMMELKVSISEMVKNFIILPSESIPELSADLILRSKNGVNIKLKPRNETSR